MSCRVGWWKLLALARCAAFGLVAAQVGARTEWGEREGRATETGKNPSVARMGQTGHKGTQGSQMGTRQRQNG